MAELPSGFDVLYEGDEPDLDIIAIHGIGAHRDKTWVLNGFRWLCDEGMLPDAFPKARIMSYGYASNWLGEGSISTSLDAVADRFLRLTHNIRRASPQRHVVFIAHCFGGIVVEKAILQALCNGRPEDQSLVKNIAGIAFLGTPHRGTASAGHATVVAAIAAVLGYGRSSEILETATSDSQMLAETVRQFAVKAFHLNLRLHCFYEERETNTAAVMNHLIGSFIKFSKKTMLVGRDSACLQGHEETALTLDHFKLNKYSGPTDANYILVRDVLQGFASGAKHPVDKKVLRCLRELYVGDPTDQVDEIEEMLGKAFLNDCHGLTDHPEFQYWRDHSTNQILYICGSTKAERMRQMVGIELELTRNYVEGLVVYYHYLSGERDRAIDMYRSLIWTLVFMFRPLGRHLKELAVPEKSFKEDIREHILSAILSNMLRDPDTPAIYIVIGALDECKDGKESLLKVIEKTTLEVDSKIKWIVSSAAKTTPLFQKMKNGRTIILDDPEVASFTSVFTENAWNGDGGKHFYRIQGFPFNYSIEQAKALLAILAQKEALASDLDLRLTPTCDETNTLSSALLKTDVAMDFLAGLEVTPLETLHLNVQGIELTFDRHLLGLTQLYATTPIEVINVDIIAIHDLNGHAFLSWKDQEWLEQMWLADFLDNDLPRCRVLAYGYSSCFVTRGPEAILTYCENLLEELRRVRRTAEEVCRPLILVGHGFGAIIAAQLLVRAKHSGSRADPMLTNLYHSIKAMVFFAVPNRGMLIDTFQTMAMSIDASELNPNLVEAINVNLQQITDDLHDFINITQNRKITNFVPSSAYAAGPRPWSSLSRFVDVDSAILDLQQKFVDAIHVEADPASIVRLDTSGHPIYQSILSLFSDCEGVAIRERGQAWINAATIQESGFSIVHDPPDAIADIILIPGIEGDPWETWSPSSRSSTRRATLGKFWPAGFLPIERNLPAARILVWGFESDSNHYIDSLFDGATRLLSDLTTARPRGKSIIFIAHSLGGILLKEALRLADQGNTMDTRDILSYTAAVTFLGTPHRGDGDAMTSLDIVQKLIATRLVCSIERVSFSEQSVVQLEACQESFLEQWKSYDFRVKCFAETPVSGQLPVVPKVAATLDGLDRQVSMMPPDQAGFCRFQTNTERGYLQTVQDLALSLELVKRRELHLRDACLQSLYFSQLRDRELDISTSLDRTGTWLLEHPDYLKWALWNVPISQKRRGLLWIRGKPGSGKSTLMKSALRLSRDKGLKHSFSVAGFFFTHRSNVWLQRSPLGLFMTLLHELIQQDMSLLIAFIPIYKRKAAANPGAWTWRQEELQAFLEAAYLGEFPGVRNAMVYIDALDESHTEGDKNAYQVAYELVHFFHKVTGKEKLKVCLSSRHYPDIQIPDCPQISTEDFNGDDIALFVKERLSGIEDDDLVRTMASKVVEKASGVFLWVTLVVGSLNMNLNNLAIARDLEDILVRVPGKLEDLFKDLFTGPSAPSNIGIQTTVTIFQWILLAERPLKMDELRQALTIDRGTLEVTEQPEDWSVSRDCLPGDPEKFLTSLRFYTRGLAEIVLRWPASKGQSGPEERRQEDEQGENREGRQEKGKENEEKDEGERQTEEADDLGDDEESECEEVQVNHHIIAPAKPHEPVEEEVERKKRQDAALQKMMEQLREAGKHIQANNPRFRSRWLPPESSLTDVPPRPKKSHAIAPTPPITSFSGPSVRSLRLLDNPYSHLRLPNNPYRPTMLETDSDEVLPARSRKEMYNLLGLWSSAFAPRPIVPFVSPVQFIHESVREFFSNGQGFPILENSGTTLSVAARHESLAEYCLICIIQSPSDLSCDFVENTPTKKRPFLVYAVRSLLYHVHQVERSGRVPKRVIEKLAAAPKGLWQRWMELQRRLDVSMGNKTSHPPGYALIHHLCLEQLLLSASTLIQMGTSVNVQSEDGDSALHYVARRGNVDVVRFLVDNHADVRLQNKRGEIPLHLAVRYKANSSVIMRLLKSLLADDSCPSINDIDSEGQTPLHVAVQVGNAIAVQTLLARGASVNSHTNTGMTPLHLAVKEDHENIVTDLLIAGADINATNAMRQAPIHFAAIKTNASLLHVLVEHGANVNSPGPFGKTALHLRVMENLGIRYLIANGADIDARLLDRRTAFHLAASREHSPENLMALITAGADQNAVDLAKKTALHYAVEAASASVVKLLLQTGNGTPSLSLPDRYGRTPLHYAAGHQSLDVFRLLVEAGADLTIGSVGGITPVELAGKRVLDDHLMRNLLESKGYRKTLKNINGQMTSVLSLP